MKRVNQIWNHPLYQENFRLLLAQEADRKFCRHGLDHCLDVARLICLYEWEAGRKPDRELIYGAALLHDLGRAVEYRDGTPHEEAGQRLAAQILPDCGYSSEEQEQILEAIGSHRSSHWNQGGSQETSRSRGQNATNDRGQAPVSGLGLSALLARADKEARCCFACPAEAECKWSEDKKNHKILL